MTYVFALLSTVLCAFNLFGMISYLGGRELPLFHTDRGALISAFILALVACSFGINITLRAPNLRVGSFILGAVVGIPLLVIFIAALAGKQIPVVHTYRNAMLVLAIAVGVKWAAAIGQTINSALHA